ncbi:MAG TPA: hypothetical protein VF070_23265 [Streptosporangiaceae bacterium]
MVGEPDGNDDVLEFGDTESGQGRPGRSRQKWAIAGIFAAAVIAGATTLAVSAGTHGAAAARYSGVSSVSSVGAAAYIGSGTVQNVGSASQITVVSGHTVHVHCHLPG